MSAVTLDLTTWSDAPEGSALAPFDPPAQIWQTTPASGTNIADRTGPLGPQKRLSVGSALTGEMTALMLPDALAVGGQVTLSITAYTANDVDVFLRAGPGPGDAQASDVATLQSVAGYVARDPLTITANGSDGGLGTWLVLRLAPSGSMSGFGLMAVLAEVVPAEPDPEPDPEPEPEATSQFSIVVDGSPRTSERLLVTVLGVPIAWSPERGWMCAEHTLLPCEHTSGINNPGIRED